MLRGDVVASHSTRNGEPPVNGHHFGVIVPDGRSAKCSNARGKLRCLEPQFSVRLSARVKVIEIAI